MDPAVASAAVALLVPYLAKAGGVFAEKAGEAAWKLAEQAYQTVRRKVATDGDAYAETTLQRLQEQPENKGRQDAMANLLTEKAEQDARFGQDLQHIVQNAMQDNSVNRVMTRVYGNAWVDKVITVAPGHVGRDQHIYIGDSRADPFAQIARANGGARFLMLGGGLTGLVGFALFLFFVLSFILSIFTVVASSNPFVRPDIPSPVPWLPLGVILLFAGGIMFAIGRLMSVGGGDRH